ncbi:MAG: cation-efflux pump [Chlorobiaceae bacterium]|nr:cation-efflux pump [Chlorobiaceae bacterium]NTW74796.1 cation-efflux pump [Chlorobiaceae bacterium]
MSAHEQKKQNVALSSVAASLLLTLMKIVVGLMTGSIGILSEAAHSAMDFGAAALTWFAVRISDKPADSKHHYGHTKIESVTALIETGLLFLTSAWVVYESVKRLALGGHEIEVTWYAIAVVIISIVVDISRSRALKKIARETGSQALEADALHFSSDILSSAVVLAGLVFVHFGLGWADAVAGILVAVLVAHAAWQLGKKTIDVLVDAAPEGLSEQIEQIAMAVPGVVAIEKMRVKPAGPFVFVDLSVTVSRTIPLEKVRTICTAVETSIKEELPDSDITVNARPIVLDSETITERVHVVGLNHNLHAHNISTSLSGVRKQISFDVEVDGQLTIRQAHDDVSALEKELHEEFDGELDICIHLDPLRQEARQTRELPPDKASQVVDTIRQAASSIPEIGDVHNIKILQTEHDKLCITLHCAFDDDFPLENVHSLTSRLEGMIYQALPETGRIIIHAEPLHAQD